MLDGTVHINNIEMV